MADRTAAERQRRYRERKRAEQRKHADAVTGAVTPAVTRDAVTPPAAGLSELGARGQRLWQEVTEDGGKLKPAERVLLEEACRTADRLDVLDRILRGDQESWMSFQAVNEDGSVVRVVLNNALAEVRQQQVALKQLLAELRQSRSGAAGGGKPKPGAAPAAKTEGVAGVFDLTGRIRDLQRQASG